MQNLIEINNIHHQVNASFAIHIDQLFFQDGPIYAIAGESRAGKTMLLRILSLIQPVDEGTVTLFETTARSARSRVKLRRRLGFMAQRPYLFRGTVAQNVSLGMEYRGVESGEIQIRIQRLLKEFHLEECAGLPVEQLSEGQRQITAFVRAVAPYPEVLLLDEPTSNLDQETYNHLLEYVKMLNEDRGVMVIIATKSRDVIKRVANITINMRNGKVARILTGEHQTNVGNGKGLRIS